MQIYNGKYTSKPENPFVVFIFGMRINSILYFWLWLPFLFRLIRMVKRLRQYRDSGMMNAHIFLSGKGLGVMQYWESFDKLENFALDNNDMHMPNNKKYKKSVGKSGLVGIWHETYLVEQDKFETMYYNMPKWGLARATNHHIDVPVIQNEARQRLKMYSNQQEL
jgi:hypothetical protein